MQLCLLITMAVFKENCSQYITVTLDNLLSKLYSVDVEETVDFFRLMLCLLCLLHLEILRLIVGTRIKKFPSTLLPLLPGKVVTQFSPTSIT